MVKLAAPSSGIQVHRRLQPGVTCRCRHMDTCKFYLAGAKMPCTLALVTGDALLKILATLANPHRMRVVAALAENRNYVSALARDLGISRALLQVHLRKLESAGLVKSTVEVSDDGKAMKFYEVAPFALHLTPEVIAAAVRTLSTDDNTPTDKDLTEELR
jgi:DNA-binding transcriptional ArsR family regulator